MSSMLYVQSQKVHPDKIRVYFLFDDLLIGQQNIIRALPRMRICGINSPLWSVTLFPHQFRLTVLFSKRDIDEVYRLIKILFYDRFYLIKGYPKEFPTGIDHVQPLSRSEIVDQDMGHRDYKFSVPEDGTARLE